MGLEKQLFKGVEVFNHKDIFKIRSKSPQCFYATK